VSLNEDGQPLSQPRLIVDGDVKGGRYVSDMVDLAVGKGRSDRRSTPSGVEVTAGRIPAAVASCRPWTA
jgi:hypothetical protein